MDRRDALKKIAGGGAIIAASPAIISATAFAYGAPTPPGSPSPFTIVNSNPTGLGNFYDATITFGPGTSTCPSSAVATTPKQQNWDYIISAGSSGVSFSPATLNPTAVTLGNVTFVAQGVIVTAGAFTVTFRARYRCVSNAGTKTICKSWQYAFTRAVLGNWTAGAPVVGTTCPD